MLTLNEKLCRLRGVACLRDRCAFLSVSRFRITASHGMRNCKANTARRLSITISPASRISVTRKFLISIFMAACSTGSPALIDRFTPFSIYETRHLLNALFGLLGLWGTWRLGRFMGGGAVGLARADPAGADADVLRPYVQQPEGYSLRGRHRLDDLLSWRAAWPTAAPARSLDRKLASFSALHLGVRVGGAMIARFLACTGGVGALQPLLDRCDGMQSASCLWPLCATRRALLLPVAITGLCRHADLLAMGAANPDRKSAARAERIQQFPAGCRSVARRHIYRSTQLPWYYVPLYFGVQLPEFLLLLAGGCFVCMPWIWRQWICRAKANAHARSCLMAFVADALCRAAPSGLYDAVRHFLFAVPLLCVLAALAARQVFVWARRAFPHVAGRARSMRCGLCALLAIASATQIAMMMQLHPYEYIYANQFAGGVPGAYGRYEMDYWGQSFKEAAEKLQDYVARKAACRRARFTVSPFAGRGIRR